MCNTFSAQMSMLFTKFIIPNFIYAIYQFHFHRFYFCGTLNLDNNHSPWSRSCTHFVHNWLVNRFIINLSCLLQCSVLKIVVPDELHGSILTKTVPVRPHMTTKQVCKIIAHKARITNPQDYGLYRLVEGEGKYISIP